MFWEIKDGPIPRAKARILYKEYKDSDEYARVRILPVGEGVTVE